MIIISFVGFNWFHVKCLFSTTTTTTKNQSNKQKIENNRKPNFEYNQSKIIVSFKQLFILLVNHHPSFHWNQYFVHLQTALLLQRITKIIFDIPNSFSNIISNKFKRAVTAADEKSTKHPKKGKQIRRENQNEWLIHYVIVLAVLLVDLFLKSLSRFEKYLWIWNRNKFMLYPCVDLY